MEFTPYEVGMDKYGTFMKTELFGSKFFCGKLIEKFTESPLYYLQGKTIEACTLATSFPGSLFGGKKRDPGNEVGTLARHLLYTSV